MRKSEQLIKAQNEFFDAISARDDLHSEIQEINRGINERKMEIANLTLPLAREILDLNAKAAELQKKYSEIRVPPEINPRDIKAAQDAEALEDEQINNGGGQ